MDVQCDQCKTEYTLDETLVSKKGTSVRCTKCGHVFKAFKKSGGDDEWFVRQPNGETQTIKRLTILQKWISEGKISKQDLISKKNSPWKRIADIPELQPFFREGVSSAGKPRQDPSQHQATIRQAPLAPAKKPRRAGMNNLDEPFVGDAKIPKAIPITRPADNPKEVPRAAPPAKTTLSPPPVNFDNETTHEINIKPTVASSRSSEKIETQPTSKKPEADPKDLAMGSTLKVTEPVVKKRSNTAYADTMRTSRSVVGPKTPENRTPAMGTESAPPVPDEEGHDFSHIPAVRDDGVRWGREDSFVDSEPAWTEKGSGVLPYDDGDSELPPPRRTTGRWVIAAIVILILGSGAAVLALFPAVSDKLQSAVDGAVSSTESERFQKFFDRGQERFLLDSETAYRQADREFQKVLALKENHPQTLAALGQMYGVWAQYLRDAALDAEADARAAEEEAAAALSKEVERLQREFEEKRKEAIQWSRQAISADPTLKEALLAMADAKRLEGHLDEAQQYLDKAVAGGADAETEYVATLLEMDRGGEAESLVQRLDKVIAVKPLVRALYRKARILAHADSRKEAENTLTKAFEMNPSHEPSKILSERIKAEKTIRLIADAPSDGDATDTDAPTPTGNAAAGAGEDSKAEPTAEAAAPSDTPKSHGSANASAKEAREPRGVDGMLAKAVKLQSSGNYQGASELYKQVLDQSPNHIEALSGLATCYSKQGSSGRAIANYRRALSKNPVYGPAIIGLADTYKRSGEKSQALKYYKQYIDTNPSGRQAGIARRNIAALEAEVGAGAEAETPAPSSEDAAPTGESASGGDAPEPAPEPAEPTEVIISGPEDEREPEPYPGESPE